MTANAGSRASPRWYRPTSIVRSLALRPRVYVAVLSGLLSLAILPQEFSRSLKGVIAGDIAFAVYFVLSLRLMSAFSHEIVRRRAARQDEGRLVILCIVLLAIGASLVAIGGLLAEAKTVTGQAKLMHVLLAVVTVMLSWLVTQVVFTFHYAHEYYRPEESGEHSGGSNSRTTTARTTGISSTMRLRSARRRKRPTSPSRRRGCAGSRRCTPSCRSSSTRPCSRSRSTSAPACCEMDQRRTLCAPRNSALSGTRDRQH